MTLAELKKQLTALKAEGTKLCDEADANGGTFTDDQDARMEAISDEVKALEGQISDLEKVQNARRSMTSGQGGSGPKPAGHNATHEPNPETTGGFASIGEFATVVNAAVKARQNGSAIDDRLVAMGEVHQGAGAEGEGYLLPAEYRDEIWELVNDFDEFGPLIDEEPTAKREVKLYGDETTPWGGSGIQAYWRSEGQKMDASKVEQDARNVPLHELYTFALATEELLEDAPRLSNRLGPKAAQAIAYKKNLSIVSGDGVGKPLGFQNAKSLITVGKEAGQSAGTINAKNIAKMFSRLLPLPGDKPFWLVSQDCLPELMFLTIGDKPIWTPSNGFADAPGGYLLGLPIRFSIFAEPLGSKGDIQLISPKGYYGVRRSAGVKFATSIHLFFDYGIQAFRWTFRYGGQPHLTKAVSPPKSANTRSHFVTLEARA